MTEAATIVPIAGLNDPGDCWNVIGVAGDRSCPKLAEAIHCRNCPVFSAAGQQLFQREAPPDYLTERTRQLAEAEEAVSADMRSLLVFRIGPEWLAISARAIVEVVEPRQIHRVPHRTDRLLQGLVNIRGELHLCVSLRELLGIDSNEGNESRDAASSKTRPRLVVVILGPDTWAFPVDEVEGVHRVAEAAMEDLPYTVQKSPRYYSNAIFSHNSLRIGLLSKSRLSQALERIAR
jgi:chemotaxis-related protein WspD